MANISVDTDLVINRLSQAKFNQLCSEGKLDDHQLYITEYDYSAEISTGLSGLSTQIDELGNTVIGIQSSISSIAPSAFQDIEYPAATMRSVQQTLMAILSVLKREGVQQ